MIRAFVAVCCFAIIAPQSFGQEKKAPAYDAEAAMKAATPGPIHKEMAKRAGEYTTKTKMTMGPDSPPQETTGKSKITSMLGGRFLMEEVSGTMMGQPFTSVHMDGYNNITQKYESTWMYTGSTAQMSMSGTSKDNGKTIEYVATYDAPGGGKNTMQITTRIINDNEFVVRLTGKQPDGSPGPTLETTYTRVK